MPAMNRVFPITLCLLATQPPDIVCAANPWPAEANTAALKLPVLDPYFKKNMSGAYWNATTRTFWVCCNGPGSFWALVEDKPDVWKIATQPGGKQARWETGGDMEGICQTDDTKPLVYLMDETGYIREFDVSKFGVVKALRTWDIRASAGPNGGSGPEGITFVPDAWLRREGFRDASGTLRASSNGMGGLMFVGHQTGGYVHVFDLNPHNNTFSYYGKIKTSQTETADLSFDRATGKLYLWHNTGPNFLEVAELNSTPAGNERKFRTLIEYTGPRGGNLEGIALVSHPKADGWIMLTDDDNTNDEALTIYKHFRPNQDTDKDGLTDDWELRFFGSTAITDGTADADGDKQTDLQEFQAGTDPAKANAPLRPR
ncbi:MAG: hypothetical protein NTV46_10815 [Verrucomicrobia bacterium]|nr:hypothetical protein [Verrucomicrobiota bacterium]